MFDALAVAIEELESAGDGESLAEILRLRDRLDARISAMVSAFDRDGLWALDEASSATAWLRQHAALSNPSASSMVRTAKRLAALPVLASAWLSGAVTGGQVQAVVAQLNDRVAGLFADHEGDLVSVMAGLSV